MVLVVLEPSVCSPPVFSASRSTVASTSALLLTLSPSLSWSWGGWSEV